MKLKYLLDTNAIIAILQGHPGLLQRLRRHRPEQFAISSIVAHELYFGAFKSSRISENLARIEHLRFIVLDFDREDARRAGELRAALAAAGTPIGPYDVLIAGQALARGLTLITRNLREFSRTPGLSVQDWQA